MPVIVHLQGTSFDRPVVHVRTGHAVKWVWPDDGVLHTVTSSGKRRFRSSGYRKRGARHRVVFRSPGTYRYHCEIHAGMRGRVIVSIPPKR